MNVTTRIDSAVDRLSRKGCDIQPLSAAPWVDDIEDRFGRRLPESYRSLVLRYSFSEIELGPVLLFANRGEMSADDIMTAPFKDPILSAWLIRGGYFHFARSSSGDYDPICLDVATSTSAKRLEAVVRFDHEAILLEQSVVPREIIAESFLGLLSEYA